MKKFNNNSGEKSGNIERKSFNSKPSFGGNRPSFSGDRPSFGRRSSGRPMNNRSPITGFKPDNGISPINANPEHRNLQKSFEPRFNGGSKSFGDRPQGDRPSFGGDRPQRSGGFAGRSSGPRTFGDRPRRNFGDSAPQSFGDRPQGDRPSFGGDRPQRSGGFNGPRTGGFGGRSSGPRTFGDRPKRNFGDSAPQSFGGYRRSFGKFNNKPNENSESTEKFFPKEKTSEANFDENNLLENDNFINEETFNMTEEFSSDQPKKEFNNSENREFSQRNGDRPQRSGGFGRSRTSGPRTGGFAGRSNGPRTGGFGGRSSGPRTGGFGGRSNGPRTGGFAGRSSGPRTFGDNPRGNFGDKPQGDRPSFGGDRPQRSGGFTGPRTGGFGGRTGGFPRKSTRNNAISYKPGYSK